MRRHFTLQILRLAILFQILGALAWALPQAGEDARNEAAERLNRATEYTRQKEFAKAADLYEQANVILEKALGADHPVTVAERQRYEAFRRSLISELLDRFIRVTSLAEFRDREFDQSLSDIRGLLPLVPMGDESYEQLRNILVRVGLKAEAEIVLQTGLKTFPSSRLLRIHLAEVLSDMGRSAEALRTLEEARQLSRPDGLSAAADREQRATVFVRMGNIYLSMSNMEDAIAAYRRAVEIAPDWPDGRISLGKAYFAVNRLQEAQTEFERIVRQVPDNKEAHLNLAGVYLARRDWEGAARAAERAIEMGPSDSQALYLLGTALTRMGQREEGQARLREFGKTEAESKDLERRYRDIDAISVAAIRSLQEGNGNEALRLLIQGIASHPESSRLHMNLAMVLSRMGQHEKAVETLESMLNRTNDGRYLIHLNLADEYRILGDTLASERHRQIYMNTREAEFLGSAAK